MNRSTMWTRLAGLLTAVVIAVPSAAAAQAKVSPLLMPEATRAELTSFAADAERLAADPATSGAVRTQKRVEAGAIRERLTNGDLRIGDRFVMRLTVGGTTGLDTVVVRDSMLVTLSPSLVSILGVIPDLSMRGVLRSELQEVVERHVRKFIREPVVRVNALTRVSVMGAVGRPGFYFLDPDRLLADAITAAGGPGASADLERTTVRRDGREIIGQKYARQALREGRTLDQLMIRSGDVITVGTKKERNWASIAQIGLLVLTTLLAVIGVLRQAYGD
jgi:protein involved in polysaccharide export with SLBB domain